MSLSKAVDACDLPALIRKHCGERAARGLGLRGGTIRDPRPGHEETDPSFSVWRRPGGAWLWKRRGGEQACGNAFDFLVSIGLTPSDARRELHAVTNTASHWSTSAPAPAPRPADPLAEAREKAREVTPATRRELDDILRAARPLHADHPAARDLQRRGLWPLGSLRAMALGGNLIFVVHGPDGRAFNIKRRHYTAGRRYDVMVPGRGTPAWCNPGYGRASAVLLVEGELNAAAAWRAITTHGLDLDVQGLAGTDTWPFLQGLDRPTLIYADDDQSGMRMRARLQDLAFAAGAARVTQVPPLQGQDFCDLLGQGHLARLSDLLQGRGEAPRHEPGLFPADIERALLQQADRPANTAADPAPLLPSTAQYEQWPMMRAGHRPD